MIRVSIKSLVTPTWGRAISHTDLGEEGGGSLVTPTWRREEEWGVISQGARHRRK